MRATATAGTASFGLGVVLVLVAYHQAGGEAVSSGPFALFWLGMILLWGPLALACTIDHRGPRRAMLLGVLGLVSFLPAFVRAPTSPTFNDADGHYAEAEQIVRTGQLFVSDGFITMASKYQGLEVLTAELTKLSGLPLFRVGTILIALFHVLSVTGVYVLAESIFSDRRAAMAAALLYAISPAISFVDSLYAYESYAIPLMIWVVALALRGVSQPRGRARRAYFIGALITGACLDLTHHLTSYEADAFLLLIAGSFLIQGRKGFASSAYAAGLGGLLAAGGVAWVVVRDVSIVPYLSYYPRQAVDAISHALFGTRQAAAPGAALALQGSYRSLFSGASPPSYEAILALVSQPILLLLALRTVWRRDLRGGPAFGAVLVVAAAYFVTLPFDLTSAGSQGVHRSWAFTWVGIAIICGRGLAARRAAPSPVRTDKRRWVPAPTGWVSSRLSEVQRLAHGRYRRVLYSGVALILLCGAYGGDVNIYQMFPGSFVMEADGRATSEQIDAARWFARHEGLGLRIATDHRNLQIFTAEAQAVTTGFPTWDLFYPTSPPGPAVRQALYYYGVQFVIVDRRLATDPSQFLWFANASSAYPSDPLPMASVTKFAHLPYLRAVHSTANLTIYRVIDPP